MNTFTYVLDFVVCPNSDYFDTDRRISFDSDMLPTLHLPYTHTHTHTHTHTQTHTQTHTHTNTHTHTQTHTHKMLTIPRIRGRKLVPKTPMFYRKFPSESYMAEIWRCYTVDRSKKKIMFCPEEKNKNLLSSSRNAI
jgi:hypothetical protein